MYAGPSAQPVWSCLIPCLYHQHGTHKIVSSVIPIIYYREYGFVGIFLPVNGKVIFDMVDDFDKNSVALPSVKGWSRELSINGDDGLA